jgi:hypothetical protein
LAVIKERKRDMTDELQHETPPAVTQEPARHHESASRRLAWGWWFFLGGALFYLLSEHRAHLFGALPYLILLACPLMHFVMHGKHGGPLHRDRGPGSEQ